MATIVDLIKALAWPAVIVWAVWYFREELKVALKRITGIKFNELKFGPPEQQIASPPSKVTAQELPASEPDLLAPKPDVRTYIERIKSFISPDQLEPVLQNIRTELPGAVGTNQADQLEALKYLAASLLVQLSHEKNYNVIFGSQLRLLSQANVGAVAPEVAKAIYERARTANPVYGNYSFDQWIGFLINAGLITHGDGGYVLTNLGRGFLKYLIDVHKSLLKQL